MIKLPKPHSWDLCMMEQAVGFSKMSKDPSSKVGCVIVSPDKTRITGGYNGFPPEIPDYADWWNNRDEENGKFTKYDLILHAEVNAILQAKTDLKGWTMYVTRHPCLECCKWIIKTGIDRIVYLDRSTVMDLKTEKGDAMFKIAGISIEKLELD